jgi:uncharacterized protein with NRDE domain
MCTLSYFAGEGKVIITSNRDEHVNRSAAIPPKQYSLKGYQCYYPIDSQSMGTWFGLRKDGLLLILLNGGEESHLSSPPYRLSRGLILLELLGDQNPEDLWNQIDLFKIEPFTLVLYKKNRLIQYQWNGAQKSQIQLDNTLSRIWCSSTLYNKLQCDLRAESFENLLSEKGTAISEMDILNLHAMPDNGSYSGFLLNRDGIMVTKNIIQCVIDDNGFSFYYSSLSTERNTILFDHFS